MGCEHRTSGGLATPAHSGGRSREIRPLPLVVGGGGASLILRWDKPIEMWTIRDPTDLADTQRCSVTTQAVSAPQPYGTESADPSVPDIGYGRFI
jgi:hypothetical protein